MATFKLKMGMSNYAILNALRKKEEMMVMAQQGQAAADHDNANWECITEAQAVHKVFEMFKATGETAAADSLSGYMLAGSTIPPSQTSFMTLIAFLR